jgi:hypothetical protein
VRYFITSREIQTAVRLLLPENMANQAVEVGTSAVTKTKYKSQTKTNVVL